MWLPLAVCFWVVLGVWFCGLGSGRFWVVLCVYEGLWVCGVARFCVVMCGAVGLVLCVSGTFFGDAVQDHLRDLVC